VVHRIAEDPGQRRPVLVPPSLGYAGQSWGD